MSLTDIPMGSHHDFLNKCRACMKLHPLSDTEEMKAKLRTLRELCKDAPHADAMVQGVNLGEYLHPMREMLAMPATSSIAEILDAVEDMIDAAIDRHEAQLHGMSDAGSGNGTTTNTDIAVQLGETKEKNIMLLAEKERLDNEIKTLKDREAGLTLQLKDALAGKSDAEAKVAQLESDIAKMRDEQAKLDEQARVDRVAEAFDTYKDSKKLTDDNKAMMLITLKADSDLFNRLYPRVPADQRHLLRDMTTQRTPTGATAPQGNPTSQTTPSAHGGAALNPGDMVKLADRLVDEKKMDRGAAVSLAYAVAMGKQAMPIFGN